MLPSSIQISGEPLSGAEVRDICRGLRDNAVRLLSLRGCRLCDRDFGRICRALAGATSLAQLNLNLGVVSSPSRIKQLAEALRTNQSAQTLLDMVENYPTALRSLVLAENSISPELQQQICDLLSEGEEEEEMAGGAADTQEWERGREPAAHQRSGSSWMCPSDPSSQMVLMTSGLGDSLLAETEM